MIWKFLSGFSLKSYAYIAAFFAAIAVAMKVKNVIVDNTVADIQKNETDKFEESRDGVVKEQQEVTGLSNSDVVSRMRSRHD